MIQIRRSGERGYANHGWLKSHHSFSFAGYYDSAHMGFRSLRVINEDRIEGGTGFGRHPHRDMEIISYVVRGALEHQDSMGNKAVILPGEVQRMSAGTGVMHSEQNHSSSEEAHFFQIWILPSEAGGTPGYGQKSFEKEINEKPLVLVVSKDGRDGSIAINQDAELYISRLETGGQLEQKIAPGRHAWLQVVRGKVEVNGTLALQGDGIAASDERLLRINAKEPSELLIFDLA